MGTVAGGVGSGVRLLLRDGASGKGLNFCEASVGESYPPYRLYLAQVYSTPMLESPATWEDEGRHSGVC